MGSQIKTKKVMNLKKNNVVTRFAASKLKLALNFFLFYLLRLIMKVKLLLNIICDSRRHFWFNFQNSKK